MLRWFVFFSACLVAFLHIGLVNSIGIIFVDVMETFNATRAETAVIQSTALGVGPGVGMLSGLLIPKFGLTKCSVIFSILACVGIGTCYLASEIWHMVMSFGVTFGFGFVNLFICSTVALSQHFTGRIRLLMLSIQATAVGFGGMAYPYILTYLSSNYGFRGALLIIGGITLNCIPCSFIWKQSSANKKNHAHTNRIMQYQTELAVNVVEEDNSVVIQRTESEHSNTENDIYYIRTFPVLPYQRHTKRVSICEGQIDTLGHQQETNASHKLIANLGSLLSNRYFLFFWAGTTLAIAALSMPIMFLADIFVDKGLSQEDVVFVFFLLNILNIMGQIIPGLLMQIKCMSALFCPLISTIWTVAVMVAIVFASSRMLIITLCVLVGIPFGMFQAMMSVVTASLVGVDNLPTASGIVFTTVGVMNAIVRPAVGYIRDASGSYDIPIFVTVGITGLGVVLFMVAFIHQTMESSRIRRRSTVFYLTSF